MHFIRLFEIKILHSRVYEFLGGIGFNTDLGIDPKFVFLYDCDIEKSWENFEYEARFGLIFSKKWKFRIWRLKSHIEKVVSRKKQTKNLIRLET